MILANRRAVQALLCTMRVVMGLQFPAVPGGVCRAAVRQYGIGAAGVAAAEGGADWFAWRDAIYPATTVTMIALVILPLSPQSRATGLGIFHLFC